MNFRSGNTQGSPLKQTAAFNQQSNDTDAEITFCVLAFCEHFAITLSAACRVDKPAADTAAMGMVDHYKNAEVGKNVVDIAPRQA